MKKNINFNYKYSSSNSERIKLIKETGFDGVFIYSQYNPQGYIPEILEQGLEIESLHLPYKLLKDGECVDSRYVNVLWLDNVETEAYVDMLIREIDLAKRFNIRNLVMHVTGGNTPPPANMSGVEKVKKIVDYCEKKDINLCLENLRCLDYLDIIFKNIQSPKLKFCFDSGHANYMTKNLENFPWEKFGEKLCCLHLNDNDGSKDSHLVPFCGNINWGVLLKKILTFNNQVGLTLEVRANSDELSALSEKEYLKKCFDSLQKIESLKDVEI